MCCILADEYGDTALAGLHYVAATTTAKPGVLGSAGAFMQGMASDDLATHIESARRFVAACSSTASPARV
jgi:hypothetical protein